MPYKIKKSRFYYVDMWVPDRASAGAIHINKSTRCTEQAAAQQIEDDWRADAEEEYFKSRGQVICSDSMMLSDAAEQVHQAVWQHNRTGAKSKRQIEIIIELVGDMPLTDLSGAPGAVMVENIKKALLGYSVAGKNKGRPIGPDTVDRYMAALKTLLNHFRKDRMMADLVVPPIKAIGAKRTRKRELFLDEERKLFAKMRAYDPDYCDLFEFLLDTGLRVSEALALRYYDGCIRLADGVIVASTLKRSDNPPRTVHLTKRAKAILTRRQGRVKPFDFTPTQVSHVFRRYRLALGIEDRDFVPHMLRHTCTTRLLDAGYPLTKVQAMLGHSDSKMTLLYNRGNMDGGSGAADILNNLQGDKPVVDPKDLEITALKEQIAALERQASKLIPTEKHHSVVQNTESLNSRGIKSGCGMTIDGVTRPFIRQ